MSVCLSPSSLDYDDISWSRSVSLREVADTHTYRCRSKPQPSFASVSVALPVLGQLLGSGDNEVLQDACWALSYLSDGTAILHDAALRVFVLFLLDVFHRWLKLSERR